MTYPVLLSAVVVTSAAADGRIRFVEGAGNLNADLRPGTYFLRGDGAADDLCLEIKTALEATGANTYSVGVSFDVDADNATATVTITRTAGADTCSLSFASGSTTFDPALIGFAAGNTANNASAKVSTLSPSSVWVSSDIYRELEPDDEVDGFAPRALSGRVRAGSLGAYDVRRLGFALVGSKRTHARFIAADTARAFSTLWRRWAGGPRCELHVAAIASGTTLAALSSSTEEGAGWHLDEGSAEGFAPSRLNNGVALYSWDLRLLGYVA